ncbi:MAG: hypothetical protein IPM54_00985 [Polyangiaceae bacterium]|nr:hypothetical protein [Polyangiaceae bacterium]
MRNVVLLLAIVALGACNKPDADQSKPAAKPAPETTASAAKPLATETAPTPAAPPPPTSLPARPGRSLAPTLAEWNAQQKEVTVKGSSALNCETKIVREYLRVSCRGKNDSGGTPTSIVIQKGGHGEAITYVGPGITSLVVPFVEGIDFAADFSWTDKSHKLVVSWPRGNKQPAVVGVFEGAKSPIDGTSDAALAEKLCNCHRKVTKENSCESMIGGPNVDCDRTYGNDCETLLECSRGEPGAWPRCQPGWVNAGIGFCFQQCGDGKAACPANHTCEDIGNGNVCVAN